MARTASVGLGILAATFLGAVSAHAQASITPVSAPSPVVMGDQYGFSATTIADECPNRSWFIQSGSLPPGISMTSTFNPPGVQFIGRPTASGTFQFQLRADPPVGCSLAPVLRDYTITVTPFAILPSPLPPAAVGQSYQSVLSVNSDLPAGCFQYQFAGGSLPSGISVAPVNQSNQIRTAITGTPLQSGLYQFTITVNELMCDQSTEFLRSLNQDFNLNVYGLTTTSLVDGTAGRPYSQQIRDNFPSPPTYSSDLALPAGMTLSSSGLLGGTPANPGNYVLRIRATSQSPQLTTSATYNLTINPPVSMPTSTLPDGTVGVVYPSTAIPTAGGTTPILFSVVSGTLPPGLTLSAGQRLQSSFSLPKDPSAARAAGSPSDAGFPGTSGGVLSGTPTTAGNFTFTVRATEAYGGTADRVFSMVINGPPGINPPTLPGGVVGVPYSQLLTAPGQSVPSFQLESGSLPNGLTLSPSGALSGTPTTQGSFSFTVRAPLQSTVLRRDYTIVISGALSFLTPADLPAGRVSTPYSLTFQATGGVPPYSINNEVVNVPPGLSYNPSTFALSGTPTAPGTYTIDLLLRDSNQPAGSVFRSFRLVIAGSASITTSSLPAGAINQAYRATLASDGFVTPPTWTIAASALPPGLVLDPATGVISGTPTAEGIYPFQVAASTSTQSATPRTLQITIGIPALDFSPETLPPATVGVPYAQAFTAVGGDGNYAFSQTSGTPPPGLTLSPAGALTGTPTTPGTFRFSVRVTSGSRLIEKQITLLVDSVALELTPATLSDAAVNVSYTQTLVASGGKSPYAFQVSTGALPPGVSLSSGGVISGTPSAAGSFTFAVQVSDANNKQLARNYTLVVRTSVMITTGSLPDATQAEPYSATIAAGGGAAPYSFSITGGSLPPGLTLATTGALSGTPTQAGTFSFTVTGTDANQRTATANLSIRVFGQLSFVTTTLPDGLPLRDYSAQLAVQGGVPDYVFEIVSGALPDGILFNAGSLRGAPTRSGTFTFDVKVTDSRLRTATRRFTITVGSGPSISIQGAPPAGQTGVAYTAQFSVNGGTQPYRWSVTGTLPPGLNLNPSSGAVSGTPTTAGTFSFTLRAEDANNLTASSPFTITVSLGALPAVRLTTGSTTSGPSDQVNFNLSLASAYPVAVDGVLALDFKPDRGFDDPAVTFANGARSLNFTIPAGNTSANFTVSRTALQTGTVAGLITLASKLSVAGADVTPSPAPAQTIRIDPAAPVITRLDLNKTATGFELIVFGFSTPRQVSQATVRLTPAAGVTLPANEFPIQVATVFTTWYADAASAPFGSQFRLVLPFTVSESGVIQSATVTLSNSIGNSAPATVNF